VIKIALKHVTFSICFDRVFYCRAY